jgi:DNA-binding PadR family transcriptional regulator
MRAIRAEKEKQRMHEPNMSPEGRKRQRNHSGDIGRSLSRDAGRMRGGRGRPEGGSPFGGFRERGFGHGPHVVRGDVRSAALALLADGPRHGYQIIQEIGERSGGVWRPSPGSVYPALQLLEDEGLIRAEQVETRRVFHLTEAGRTYVAERREELAAVWNAVTESVDDAMVELRDLFEQVGAAVRHVVRAGGKAELAEARQLLVNTRRQLYRILADAEPVGNERQSGAATPVR